jgi:uncharacterized phage protein (TIGR02220 family)|tara:strand:+ start:857 stop:1600 length:744 start_codon:yes stop_codon:yes gene_type:complete
MYGKIFDQIYEGTLAGNWEVRVVFQDMIVLAEPPGILDITSEALSGRTGVPLEIVKKAITHLEAPDPESRSREHEGRRIVRLDNERSWGWIIVNYEKYMNISRQQERKEYLKDYMRDYMGKKRKSNKSLTESKNKQILHTTDSRQETKRTTLSSKKEDATEILNFLNSKRNGRRPYLPAKTTMVMIENRLKEGATVQDFKSMIALKFRQWGTDDRMSKYLRPKTLFNASNFSNYIGELGEDHEETLP